MCGEWENKNQKNYNILRGLGVFKPNFFSLKNKTMKNITLIFSAFFMLVFSAQAQDQRSTIGLKTGVNFANIGGDADTDMRLGYHLGGFAKIQLSDAVAIQPEILYSLQGYKTEGASFGGVTFVEEENVNLHYINIPVMFKFYPMEGFNLQVGPQFGYLAAVTFDGEDVKEESGLQDTDFGLAFGAGFDLNDVQIGARYNLGISDIVDDQDDSFKAQNRVIQVYIGFAF